MTERDPIIQKYRRDVFIRILLPFILVAIIIVSIIGGMGFLVATDMWTMDQLRVATDILLIIFILLPAVLLMILVDFAIIMLAWGNGKLPQFITPVIRWVRRRLLDIAGFAEQGADYAVRPLIFVEKFAARLSTFLADMLKFFESNDEQDEAHTQPETKIHVEEL